MVTDALSKMMSEAGALGVTFQVVDDHLQVTMPKTAEATALAQRMKPHKDALKIMLETAQPPPLPATLWVTGLATFAEARRLQRRLSERYVTRLGMGDTGFYVAGSNSGLCAVYMPYEEDIGADDQALPSDKVVIYA